jgi:2-polyprenyl-3-methyl-5-hydroxy-6-metoxy-1,4-benzoquinol methylase
MSSNETADSRKIDIGNYNKDQDETQRLTDEVYQKYPDGVLLTSEYAELVQENLLHLLIRLARYKFVTKMIKSTDSVLEVGSGSGLGAIFLGQHCRKVTGIEVKTTEVAEARGINKRDNVEFRVCDLFDLPRDEKFDVVVSLDVIEHMPIEMGREFVKAQAAHLKDDGMLILGSPSIHSFPYQSALSQSSHVKCYDQPELLEVINPHVQRTLAFSMNDELVHTGYSKLAWYYFVIGFGPRKA